MEVGRPVYSRPGSPFERNSQAFRSWSETIRIHRDPRARNFVGRGLPQRLRIDERRELTETRELRSESGPYCWRSIPSPSVTPLLQTPTATARHHRFGGGGGIRTPGAFQAQRFSSGFWESPLLLSGSDSFQQEQSILADRDPATASGPVCTSPRTKSGQEFWSLAALGGEISVAY